MEMNEMTLDCIIFTVVSVGLILWAEYSYYHHGVVERWARKKFARSAYRGVMIFFLVCSVVYVIISALKALGLF